MLQYNNASRVDKTHQSPGARVVSCALKAFKIFVK